MKPAVLLTPIALILAGCNTECQDPSRISGVYEVFSSVETHSPEDVGEMYTYGPFYNGVYDWDLTYVPASDNFRLAVDGQEFTAIYTEAAGNCNRFELRVGDGSFTADATQLGDTAEVTSTHQLTWIADLTWQGEEISGNYTVTDNWSLSSGESGTLEASGLIAGSLLSE